MDTRTHILQCSFKLFLQSGFKAVTMNQILDASGLSKGAFYHYFKSKEEVFEEIVNQFVLPFAEVDYSKFDQTSLRGFLNDYIQQLKDSTKELQKAEGGELDFNFMALIFEVLRVFPGYRDKFVALHDKEVKAWDKVIKTAQKKGEIKNDIKSLTLAHVFVNNIDGLGIRLLVKQSFLQSHKELKKIMDDMYAMFAV
ncbi:MAG: TetR family transcriptional regulator [Bacteroidetes bacterium]|nr:TetR family transcriptional regulator [Bacteroidota bacterium]